MRQIRIIIGQTPFGQPIYYGHYGCAGSVELAPYVLGLGGWKDYNYEVEVSEYKPGESYRTALNRPFFRARQPLNPRPGEHFVLVLGAVLQLN